MNNLLTPLIGDLGIVNYLNLFIVGIIFYQLKSFKNIKCDFIILFALIYEFIFKGIISGLFVSSFILIFYALINNKLNFLNRRLIIYFGTISYSLYLTHSYIGFIIIYHLQKNGYTSQLFIIVPIIISIGLAHLITFYIEKPIQKYLLQKFTNRRLISEISKKVISAQREV